MHFRSLKIGLILGSLLPWIDAAVIEGRLLGATFRGQVVQGVSMKTTVLLNRGLYQTHIQRDGTFAFPDVPTGAYILEVHSPNLSFPKVRIMVTSRDVIATRISLGDHFSNYQQLLPLPLVLSPRTRPRNYISPEGAKFAGWFANPLTLMASFSLLMLLVMPRIMANLDEDALHALRPPYEFGRHRHYSPQHPARGSMMHPPCQPVSMTSHVPFQLQYYQPQLHVDGALDQHPSNVFRSPTAGFIQPTQLGNVDNTHKQPIPMQPKKQK
ncbi:hypothetical protein BCR41DRAFT_393342 [Lobosporangium transversale]|uniref:ER membrane protein complex subunit 7 beta-sandwich domain-containing protein n=1 Tax=Lobosporangium transversale TaxID=64571 RepID=A0A1Y2GWU5_9FUNG|nr:hypothetical protein BCR41DRAFT_393342 [Lobosporangium transversale]ORZ26735.1 hypothetical protein BCR41DRAFT_393342 [Lobosporangium transversale]|eukprot:XP_021884498.1 hypothetical protein BCR41DRAFT_393342 [Lobosporangium transversale]